MSKYVPEYLRAMAEHPEQVADLVQAVERALGYSRMLGEDGIVPSATEDVLAKVNALRAAIGAEPIEDRRPGRESA
jgi:hypothetical protein